MFPKGGAGRAFWKRAEKEKLTATERSVGL